MIRKYQGLIGFSERSETQLHQRIARCQGVRSCRADPQEDGGARDDRDASQDETRQGAFDRTHLAQTMILGRYF